MTQIAQLSEAEIEDRFHIVGTRPVAFLLAGYVREGTQFSVQFRGDSQMFLTRLLAVQVEQGKFIFDCSGSPEVNRAFLNSERAVFVGRPDNIHVQFTIGAASETTLSGGKAFIARLPEHVVRLQRREAFRIETPRVKPLQFYGRLPDGNLLNLPAHDISVAGIGLNATSLPELELVPGMRLSPCRFVLPDDPHDLHFSATLAHVTEQESRSGQRHWRIGLRFDKLTPVEEARIQRYIVRVERERHELL